VLNLFSSYMTLIDYKDPQKVNCNIKYSNGILHAAITILFVTHISLLQEQLLNKRHKLKATKCNK